MQKEGLDSGYTPIGPLMILMRYSSISLYLVYTSSLNPMVSPLNMLSRAVVIDPVMILGSSRVHSRTYLDNAPSKTASVL